MTKSKITWVEDGDKFVGTMTVFFPDIVDEAAPISEAAWEALSAMAGGIPMAPYFRRERTRGEVKQALRELERHADDHLCICGEHEVNHVDPIAMAHHYTDAYEYHRKLMLEELEFLPEDEDDRIMNITRVMSGGHSRE